MSTTPINTATESRQQPVAPDVALKKQLQKEGLEQAAEFQKQYGNTVTVTSSQKMLAVVSLKTSLDDNVEVDGKKNQTPLEQKQKENESLFDFEEVANNVMQFVGGVIRSAAKSGADEDYLGNLFSQAREGVGRGIAMARKDLGGSMNDDIENGISNSENLIEKRLQNLEDLLLPKAITPEQLQQSDNMSLSASSSDSASLLIRTQDGDEISIQFDSTNESRFEQSTEKMSVSNYQQKGFHFSISGELDQQELKAMTDLVGAIGEVGRSFFDGNVEQAFNSALELGYDESELKGFALQLNRQETATVTKTYSDIQHMNTDSESSADSKPALTVAKYLAQMLDVMNQAQEKLNDKSDVNTILRGLMEQLQAGNVADKNTDLVSKFAQFNNKFVA